MKNRYVCFALAGLVAATVECAVAGDVFRWVDSRGVIHFTDNYESIPPAFRNLPNHIVRYHFAEEQYTDAATARSISEPAQQEGHDVKAVADVDVREQTQHYVADRSGFVEPAEVSVIVVNNFARHGKKFHCRGSACQARFKPNFNDRQYIHPSVFNGGSRQYVHPNFTGSRRK